MSAGQSWGAPKHVRVFRARALAAPSTVSLGIVPETTPIHANFSSITPTYFVLWTLEGVHIVNSALAFDEDS